MREWLALAALFALAAPGVAQARARPTFAQAHLATHLTLDDYAGVVDGRLGVGPCRRVGRFTTVCRGRIDGPVRERYRILVTGTRARNYLLAGSLAKRRDAGGQLAADGVRNAFRKVTEANLAEVQANSLTAAVDAQGTRWALGAYAAMHCSTIGRHATSRGLADRVGVGRAVTIDVGDCDYCAGFAGDAVIGEDALPPFHPNRSCVAS